ncbi:MAG TPA: hypothetical protein VEM40_12610 [Nitrospirota bacterium]|nr:hypothetical protein [Nitrospirota bacterium]
MKRSNLVLMVTLLMAVTLSSCTSVGTLGVVTRTSADPAAVLKNGQSYKELGPTEGEACRYFLLAIVPWGDATFSKAVDNALAKSGGDALVNVTVTNSLYGFIPIYNFFSYTCTEVKGIAIQLEKK